VEGGWRLALHRLSGGRVTPRPSPAELTRHALEARITAPIAAPRTVAVISRKGGVGKTTTTLLLGHTFASLRADRVVALDGNPDAGSLGYRVHREHEATITDLLDDAHRINRYSDLRRYTTQTPTRLEVVASDDDPHITQAIGRNEYRSAVEVLERHFNLLLLDTGTGILDSATQGILRCADQLVVVLAPSLDGARAASLTLDWLEQHGFAGLAQRSVAVLNANRSSGLVATERLTAHFAERCRATLEIPWDPHLDAGAEADIAALRPATRDAYLELAATVADGFGDAGARRDR
jgi:putative peptide zinc metalloprotease protein